MFSLDNAVSKNYSSKVGLLSTIMLSVVPAVSKIKFVICSFLRFSAACISSEIYSSAVFK